jgi:general secretion pathway protein L
MATPKVKPKKSKAAATALPRGSTNERLQLWLPAPWQGQNSKIAWRLHSRSNTVLHGEVSAFTDLPPQARSSRVHVWTPASESLLTRIALPTASRAQIAKALPYALEDQLLEDPDKLHFAYVTEADGKLAVAVTTRERLRAWMESLERAGIRPVSMAPATLSLPWQPGVWTLAFTDGELIVRSGSLSGFTCSTDAQLPPSILSAALVEAGAERLPEKIVVINAPKGFADGVWQRELGVPIQIAEESLYQMAAAIPELNLLQGEFSATKEYRDWIRPYYPAVAMLTLWLLVLGGGEIARWWQLNGTYQKYQNEMTALFREAFPDVKDVIDPVKQMQKQLDTLRAKNGASSPNDLLPLLERASPALAAYPQIRLQKIDYGKDGLTLELAGADRAGLETLNRALRGAYLSSEVAASDGSTGKLRVRSFVMQTAAGPKP